MTSSVMLAPNDLAKMVAEALGSRVTGVECTIDSQMHLTLKGFDPERSLLVMRAPRFDLKLSATAKPVGRTAIEVTYEIVAPRIVMTFIDTDSIIDSIRLPFCRFRPLGPRKIIISMNSYRIEECRIPAEPHALEVRFSSEAA